MERKRLGAVAAEIDALVVLEEAEVEPRDEPSELDLEVQSFSFGPERPV